MPSDNCQSRRNGRTALGRVLTSHLPHTGLVKLVLWQTMRPQTTRSAQNHITKSNKRRGLFLTVSCDSATRQPQKDVGELIKSTYKLQIDPRSRAAFNSYFDQHFKFESGSASQARQALLFMCWFYSAVSTFIEAARRIPSCRKVSFVLVKPLGIVPGSQTLRDGQ